MVKYDLPFIFLHISSLLSVILLVFILKIKNKKQIHYAFTAFILLVCLWNLTFLSETYLHYIKKYNGSFFAYVNYFIIIILPLAMIFMAEVFNQTKITFSLKYLLMSILPLLDLLILITNPFHHLFFVASSADYSYQDGILFNYHLIITYTYSFFALGLLVYYAIKNSGFFSKQAILIFIGSLLPLAVNIVENFVDIGSYATARTFSITVLLYMFAMFKFDFLNVAPIALEKVVDHISDSFIVINEDFEIIDYNRTFARTFSKVFKIKRKENLLELVRNTQGVNLIPDKAEELISIAIETKKSNMYEKRFVSIDGDFDRYFEIEITPIMSKTIFIGILLLFRDITLHKENLQKIKQAHNQLMQRERLASLGEIAGGVAHDINSPLSSIQTELHIINTLATRIEESGEITQEKVLQYLSEIKKRIQNTSSASQKIVKIVNSVRNHTRNLSGETVQDFYIGSIFDDLKILLDHQLKQANCELMITKEEVMVNGDPGKLSQVMTNLIMNAMQAYAGKSGRIDIDISTKGEKLLIKVTDFAGGIPKDFQEGIFKNILTTKGTQGTGFGLYLCNSIITGHFGGNIWFESEDGIGTTFFVSIPVKKAA